MCKTKRGEIWTYQNTQANCRTPKYASNLPYPEIQVEPNVAESKLLMPVYSGSSGELTAVMTYCFQMYITPKYPDIQEALEGIAITEMRHHELLGKAIY